MSDTPPPSDRARVRRAPQRADYGLAAIAAVLDEAVLAHVGVVDAGAPVIVPMACVRDGLRVLLHGSSASRTMRLLAAGAPCCVTVTHLDGLVHARSAFHSSMNYRSVVLQGSATIIDDPDDKVDALRVLTDRLFPGRWSQVRWPSASELAATTVVAMPLTDASLKARTGPPADDPDDLALPVWAGVVPVRATLGDPIDAPDLTVDVEPPAHDDRFGHWLQP